MPRKGTKTGVYGPYSHPRGFRVVVVKKGGERASRIYSTEGEANQVVTSLRQELKRQESLTIEEALGEYECYLREKGNKRSSIATTSYRLRSFFPEMTLSLSLLTPKRCEKYYQTQVEKHKTDTHRNTLAQVKTFLSFCLEKKILGNLSNPAAHIKGVGRRIKGKEQLRIDEARRFIQKAFVYADEGEDGAICCLMALLLGLRASEIVDRVVRDLDDEGRLLWISHSKTEAGKRRVEIPENLRPHLRKAVLGKTPNAPLLGKHVHHDRGFVRKWTKKICRELHLPEITAHSLRGLHATLATASGVTSHAVARALGHEDIRTTHEHYTKKETSEKVKQSRVLEVLQGGKS